MNEKVLDEARKMIAGFLKARREELGISQADLADITQLGIATIKRMEDAKFWPGLKQYLIVCEALHLFPFVGTYEGDNEFSRMMRDAWTKKQGKDMSIEEALKFKNEKYIRNKN
jgi:transcriptional regulator with XRE-family HTH domain